MKPPLVTIAIPCFNAQTTIERAIKSAQNQDWPNIEILVVDDGSEDGSGAIIEALAKDDKRIRLMNHEANQGTAVARNTLLENARGEFIAFFDADDVSYSERISLQYQRLTHYEQEHKADLILCYAGRRAIPANGESSYELKGIGHKSPEPVGRDYLGHCIPLKGDKRNYVWGLSGSCSLFMRATVFDIVGSFDPALRRAQDTDYAIRAGLKGAHFISVNQTLLDWYVIRVDYKADEKILSYHLLIYKKYRHFFRNRFIFYFFLSRIKSGDCFKIARKRNQYILMIWYFGQFCLWSFLESPRSRIKKALNKVQNVLAWIARKIKQDSFLLKKLGRRN